jgi:hypothetical protein
MGCVKNVETLQNNQTVYINYKVILQNFTGIFNDTNRVGPKATRYNHYHRIGRKRYSVHIFSTNLNATERILWQKIIHKDLFSTDTIIRFGITNILVPSCYGIVRPMVARTPWGVWKPSKPLQNNQTIYINTTNWTNLAKFYRHWHIKWCNQLAKATVPIILPVLARKNGILFISFQPIWMHWALLWLKIILICSNYIYHPDWHPEHFRYLIYTE